MKTFKEFIHVNEGLVEDLSTRVGDEYPEMKEDLLEKLEKSTNSTDTKVVKEFINSYLENEDESQLEGLINSSDVYEFYLKYTSDIDEILVEKEFFVNSPESVDKLSLFDYLVYGTQQAVRKVMEDMKIELFGADEGDNL